MPYSFAIPNKVKVNWHSSGVLHTNWGEGLHFYFQNQSLPRCLAVMWRETSASVILPRFGLHRFGESARMTAFRRQLPAIALPV